MKTKKVYLIGAGAGKPDLITVRGLNVLKEADVIIYDYLVDKSILKEAKEGTELICCDELGKNRCSDGFLAAQEEINDLLVRKAKEGKRVIRLKNGDSSIFSRCSQELSTLVKNRIKFEVVPGVTAASAAASFSGVPLTDRRYSSSVVFVTGHEAADKDESTIDWGKISQLSTILLYMAVDNISKIVDKLLYAGKSNDTPVVAISRAGDINQRIVKGELKDIKYLAKKKGISAPAIFIIGRIVKLEKDFNWLRKNKRVLFTGLSKERFFAKETYFHLPLIKIEPMEDYGAFDDCLRNIKEFDWIVFASRYGVEYFFKRLKSISYDSRILSDIKIAAIGDSTKNQLSNFGILADLVPEEESSKGLLEEFRKLDLRGKKVFLTRSDISDKNLGKGFESLGAKVTTSFAYRNTMPDDLPDLDLSYFDEIMFTSPSTVRNFRKRYKKVPGNIKIRCIGNVTLKEAKRCRFLD